MIMSQLKTTININFALPLALTRSFQTPTPLDLTSGSIQPHFRILT
jgi:hypothetical protein